MSNRIVIIGSGLAGISAAVRCAELGLKVALYSPMSPIHSQSVMAMGGIAAALNHAGDDDSIEQHFTDTMAGGLHLADPNAVRGMVANAPEIISRLEEYGALFTRMPDGRIDQRSFGGHSKKRTAFCGTQTGRQLVSALNMRLRALESDNRIVRLYGYRFIRAVLDDNGHCIGCVLLDKFLNATMTISCHALIIATGGMNDVYSSTVGSAANDGSPKAALFTQGTHAANLEFVQFHPTTVDTLTKRMLISEAARGEGGRIYTLRKGEPWYFLEEKFERGNLSPRDVISREIYKICREGLGIDGKNQVYLDIRHLGAETIKSRLDEVDMICKTYLRLDPAKEPIPVYPGVHFFMGGIKVGVDHQSSIPGLYAIGECACQYHGANRLGSNSLLAAIHGGFTAAEQISGRLDGISEKNPVDLERGEKAAIAEMEASFNSEGVPFIKAMQTMHQTMDVCMNIERNGPDLQRGFDTLNKLADKVAESGINALNTFDSWRAQKLLSLAKAMILSALAREESRGAHMRSDFPETDENFQKTTVMQNDHPTVTFEEIPQEERP